MTSTLLSLVWYLTRVDDTFFIATVEIQRSGKRDEEVRGVNTSELHQVNLRHDFSADWDSTLADLLGGYAYFHLNRAYFGFA